MGVGPGEVVPLRGVTLVGGDELEVGGVCVCGAVVRVDVGCEDEVVGLDLVGVRFAVVESFDRLLDAGSGDGAAGEGGVVEPGGFGGGQA